MIAWHDRPCVKLVRVSSYLKYLSRGGLDHAFISRWETTTILGLAIVIFYSHISGNPFIPQLADSLTLAIFISGLIIIMGKSIRLLLKRVHLSESEYLAKLEIIRAFGPIGDIEAWQSD